MERADELAVPQDDASAKQDRGRLHHEPICLMRALIRAGGCSMKQHGV